jgi:hypothetical protein
MGALLAEKDRLESQVERLLTERDTVKLKIEAMLEALSILEHEMVDAVRR